MLNRSTNKLLKLFKDTFEIYFQFLIIFYDGRFKNFIFEIKYKFFQVIEDSNNGLVK